MWKGWLYNERRSNGKQRDMQEPEKIQKIVSWNQASTLSWWGRMEFTLSIIDESTHASTWNPHIIIFQGLASSVQNHGTYIVLDPHARTHFVDIICMYVGTYLGMFLSSCKHKFSNSSFEKKWNLQEYKKEKKYLFVNMNNIFNKLILL